MSAAEPASEAEEPAVAAPSPAPASADKPAPAPAADTKENEAPAAQEEAAAPASGGKMPAVGLNKRRGMAVRAVGMWVLGAYGCCRRWP